MAGGPATLHGQFQALFLGRPCRVLTPPRMQSRRLHRQVVAMSAVAAPAELDVKAFDGEAAGTEQLALRVADKSTANGLVHRYLITVRQNNRAGTASTLTRAEVRGGGRKPFNQKGTGNARMGSKRTPLRPGGGVSFGPKPKDWSIRMNKKERRLALATALQSAAPSTTVVEDLTNCFEKPSTKSMVQALGRWGVGPREYTLLIVNELSDNLALSARNVERLEVNAASAVRVYDVLRADKVIIETSALRYIQEFYGEAAEADDQPEAQAAAVVAEEVTVDAPQEVLEEAPAPAAEEAPAAAAGNGPAAEAAEAESAAEESA